MSRRTSQDKADGGTIEYDSFTQPSLSVTGQPFTDDTEEE